VFKELKRRTEAFANHFRHADPNTAKRGCKRSPSASIS
jgi:hypothetical protein